MLQTRVAPYPIYSSTTSVWPSKVMVKDFRMALTARDRSKYEDGEEMATDTWPESEYTDLQAKA